jgi:hypothetical protein
VNELNRVIELYIRGPHRFGIHASPQEFLGIQIHHVRAVRERQHAAIRTARHARLVVGDEVQRPHHRVQLGQRAVGETHVAAEAGVGRGPKQAEQLGAGGEGARTQECGTQRVVVCALCINSV